MAIQIRWGKWRFKQDDITLRTSTEYVICLELVRSLGDIASELLRFSQTTSCSQDLKDLVEAFLYIFEPTYVDDGTDLGERLNLYLGQIQDEFKDEEKRTGFGKGLRSLRKREGWTLRDLVTASDLSVGYLSALEHGHSSPSLDVLCKLAKAYDMKLSDLFSHFNM